MSRTEQDDPRDFAGWLAELRRLAVDRGLEWLVSGDGEAWRAAFEQGLDPSGELDSLADMAEWRGCGCGGG